jgi:hypothetical protein
LVLGSGVVGQFYNWDQYNGQGTNGHNVDDDGTTIPTILLTKYFKIGEPGVTKRLKRAYPEFFTETFGGSFTMITDYGSQTTQQLVSAATQSGGTWDVSNWDNFYWSGGYLQYLKSRIDTDISFEAIAFGVITSDTNPPYRFVGLSGIYTEEARN